MHEKKNARENEWLSLVFLEDTSFFLEMQRQIKLRNIRNFWSKNNVCLNKLWNLKIFLRQK